jgi:hypothetical protein
MAQNLVQVNDHAVESFFKVLGDYNAGGAPRNQRRRVAEASSNCWRDLVAGATLAAAPPPSAAAAAGTPVSAGGNMSFRAAKEQGAALSVTTNAMTGLLLRPRFLGNPVAVEIGKTVLSEAERWKLQAALRREETKGAGGDKAAKYNQSMLRETKVCKSPTPGEAWPAHRGRPTWKQ